MLTTAIGLDDGRVSRDLALAVAEYVELDASWATTHMARTLGRAPRGEQCLATGRVGPAPMAGSALLTRKIRTSA